MLVSGHLNVNAQWSLAGNAAPAGSFIGTTNATDFVIKTGTVATERMRVSGTNGRVGIGTGNPFQTLDINGGINVAHGIIQKGGSTITTTADLGLYSQGAGNWIRFVTNGGAFKFYSDATAGIQTFPSNSQQLVSIEANGKVLIGNVSAPGNYKLYVQSGILAEKVKVAVATGSQWADHVFGSGYQLKSLSEVEAFIAANKHLPNIPSAEQVVKEGIDVATMDAKLLEKIEELTLYLIEMKKENEAMRKEVAALKRQMK